MNEKVTRKMNMLQKIKLLLKAGKKF